MIYQKWRLKGRVKANLSMISNRYGPLLSSNLWTQISKKERQYLGFHPRINLRREASSINRAWTTTRSHGRFLKLPCSHQAQRNWIQVSRQALRNLISRPRLPWPLTSNFNHRSLRKKLSSQTKRRQRKTTILANLKVLAGGISTFA